MISSAGCISTASWPQSLAALLNSGAAAYHELRSRLPGSDRCRSQQEQRPVPSMGHILMDEPIHSGEGILHHPEGVDLMPADIQLSGMEVSLVNAMSRETILRQYLDTLKEIGRAHV